MGLAQHIMVWLLRRLTLSEQEEGKLIETDDLFYLPAGSYTVGRQAGQADIVVTGDKTISRKHAVITTSLLEHDSAATPLIRFQGDAQHI